MWHYVAIALIAACAGFGGGWTARDWKAGADKAHELQQQASDALRQAENTDRAATGYEASRTANAERVRVVTRTVERIVRDEPFYAGAAACLDPGGLRIVQAAAAATNPASSPAPTVPAASAP